MSFSCEYYKRELYNSLEKTIVKLLFCVSVPREMQYRNYQFSKNFSNKIQERSVIIISLLEMKKRFTRVISVMLLGALMFTSINFSPTTQKTVEAADVNDWVTGDGNNINSWAVKNEATWKKWAASGSSQMNVRRVQLDNGQKFLCWYKVDVYKTTDIFMRTIHYSLTQSIVTESTDIRSGTHCIVNKDDCGQCGFIIGSNVATFYWINYNVAIKGCASMGLQITENNTYEVYVQPFIVKYTYGTPTREGVSYYDVRNNIISNIPDLFSTLWNHYNVKFSIPVDTVPIEIRGWNMTTDNRMRLSDGKVWTTSAKTPALESSELYPEGKLNMDIGKYLTSYYGVLSDGVKADFDRFGNRRASCRFVGVRVYYGDSDEAANAGVLYSRSFVLNSKKAGTVIEITKTNETPKLKVVADHRTLPTGQKNSEGTYRTASQAFQGLAKNCDFTNIKKYAGGNKVYHIDLLFQEANTVKDAYTVRQVPRDYKQGSSKPVAGKSNYGA